MAFIIELQEQDDKDFHICCIQLGKTKSGVVQELIKKWVEENNGKNI